MKKLLRNQTGSILTTAIIVIALLSLSLTTISAQTYNVATRTSSTVTTDDERTFARTMIQSVLQEIRMYIYEENIQTFEDFDILESEELDNIQAIHNEIIKEYYLASDLNNTHDPVLEINVADESSLDDENTRKYTVTYQRSNNVTVTRNLIIELTEDEITFEDQYDTNDLDNYFDYLINDFQDYADLDCDVDCEEVVKDEYFSGRGGDLEDNVKIEGEALINPPGGGKGGGFGFGGYIMVVDGDLTLETVHEINGSGLLVISGDFIINNSKDTEINPNGDDDGALTIIVQGDLDFDISNKNHRDFTGQNFHMIYSGTSNYNTIDIANNIYDHSFTVESDAGIHNTYGYFGTDENYNDFSQLKDDFPEIFGPNAGFSEVFNYFESSFEEE